MDRIACLSIATLASNLIAYVSFMVALKTRKRSKALARRAARGLVARECADTFKLIRDVDLRVCLLEGYEQQRHLARNVTIAKTGGEPRLDAA